MKLVYITCLATLTLYGCGKPANNGEMQASSSKEQATTVSENKSIFSHQDFDKCIGDFAENISILGRGSDFPQFILQDIHNELVRQDSDSRLISAKCESEPELKAGFSEILIDGELKQSIDTLVATFPIEIFADTGDNLWYMDIKMSYAVKGINTASTPSLTQTFEVLQTYNEDRKPLTKIQVIVKEDETRVDTEEKK